MGILAGRGWQESRKLTVEDGRKPSDGESWIQWERLPWSPSLTHHTLGTEATEAQRLLEFSSGVPQPSLMEKQGEASFYILEHFYQNKRSWEKVNTVEAQAEMEKTVPFMAGAIKSPLRNTMTGWDLRSCQNLSLPPLCCWPGTFAFLTSLRCLLRF